MHGVDDVSRRSGAEAYTGCMACADRAEQDLSLLARLLKQRLGSSAQKNKKALDSLRVHLYILKLNAGKKHVVTVTLQRPMQIAIVVNMATPSLTPSGRAQLAVRPVGCCILVPCTFERRHCC
jgi:hypothetical protein